MNKKYRGFKNTLKCIMKRAEKIAPDKKTLHSWYDIVLTQRYLVKKVKK